MCRREERSESSQRRVLPMSMAMIDGCLNDVDDDVDHHHHHAFHVHRECAYLSLAAAAPAGCGSCSCHPRALSQARASALRLRGRGCLNERLAEYGWRPHRVALAQQQLSRASIYWYMREQQRGTASSSSRFQAVLFQQYSTNLSRKR